MTPKEELWSIIDKLSIKPDRVIECADGDYSAYYIKHSRYALITCGDPDDDGITTCFSLHYGNRQTDELKIIYCDLDYLKHLKELETQIVKHIS